MKFFRESLLVVVVLAFVFSVLMWSVHKVAGREDRFSSSSQTLLATVFGVDRRVMPGIHYCGGGPENSNRSWWPSWFEDEITYLEPWLTSARHFEREKPAAAYAIKLISPAMEWIILIAVIAILLSLNKAPDNRGDIRPWPR